MSKLVCLATIAMLLLPAESQQRNNYSKYKSVEAYEIRPGILMMPRYAADGQVCEIGLERRHYSHEIINLESSMDRKDIDEIVDELAPASERGPKLKSFGKNWTYVSGVSTTETSDYENVSILIYSKVLSTSKPHNIDVDSNLAVTIR